MSDKFEGVKLVKGEIEYGREKQPIAGVTATVESVGDLQSRITGTRLLMTGPFALAFRKKKDNRELFLTIDGPDFQWLVDVDPKKQKDAREFAAKVNTAARRASVS